MGDSGTVVTCEVGPLGKVCVVGAGVMGRGVSLAFIADGVQIRLVDVDDAILEAAKADILRFAQLYPLVDKSFLPVSEEQINSHLVCSADLKSAAEADFIIENVTEDWSVKEPVYHELDRICRPDVIFAVNTSAIPVARVAKATTRADRVVGMHFMNPVPLKPLVEMIRGPQTSAQTIETARTLLQCIGKKSVLVEDSPGFVTNRVMMLMVNEAIRVLEEGVASPAQVDQLFRECFGHKMGPLETCDLIGLDTVKRSLDVLYEELRDDRFVPAELLVEHVKAGKLGRKSGCGFFSYD